MTWTEWIGLHRNLFAMTYDKDADVVASWARLLRGKGYTPEEAAAASQWLAMHSPPRKREYHPQALQDRIEVVRRNPRSERGTSDVPVVDCTLCGGTGTVQVAKPESYERRQYHTSAVLCRCPLGRWILSDQRDRFPRMKPPKKPMTTLEEYEREFPEWRKMLEDMRRWLHEELHAAQLAREADRRHGPLEVGPAAWQAALRGKAGEERGQQP